MPDDIFQQTLDAVREVRAVVERVGGDITTALARPQGEQPAKQQKLQQGQRQEDAQPKRPTLSGLDGVRKLQSGIRSVQTRVLSPSTTEPTGQPRELLKRAEPLARKGRLTATGKQVTVKQPGQPKLPAAKQLLKAKALPLPIPPPAAGAGAAGAGAAGAGAAGAGAAGAGAAGAGALAAAAAPVAVVVAAVAGIALLGKAVTELAKKMVESQRELAKFSPQLAGAFAESDIRDLTRKIESSQRTGQSTADLMEALSDFKDTIQPILDVIKVVISKVLTVLVKGFTTLVHVISLGLVTLKGVAGLLEDESKKKQRTLLEPERFLVDLAQGNFHKRRDPLFAFGG